MEKNKVKKISLKYKLVYKLFCTIWTVRTITVTG